MALQSVGADGDAVTVLFAEGDPISSSSNRSDDSNEPEEGVSLLLRPLLVAAGEAGTFVTLMGDTRENADVFPEGVVAGMLPLLPLEFASEVLLSVVVFFSEEAPEEECFDGVDVDVPLVEG